MTFYDRDKHPINDLSSDYVQDLKNTFERSGFIAIENFILPHITETIKDETLAHRSKLFRGRGMHNVYQIPSTDPSYPDDHVRNKEFCFDTACLTEDELPATSYLHTIYHSQDIRNLVSYITNTPPLYPYADGVSGLTVNVLDDGMGMGWHFDSSEVAVILIIQQADEGGVYQVYEHSRWTKDGQEDYDKGNRMINGQEPGSKSHLCPPGTLVMHYGIDSLHRITEVSGEKSRISVILSYSTSEDFHLNRTNLKKFYGK